MDSLRKGGVIPDVLGDFHPATELTIHYDKGEAKGGNEMTPADTQKEPKVSWTADSNSLYALIMSDPDAPSRKEPKFREWRHWVVVNIPNSEVSKGDVVAPYMGPGPPPKTGLHRYVFSLFKQPSKLAVDHYDNSGMHRATWSVRDFAKKHHLGSPIAADFFEAKNPSQ